jgi:hypothetical protein
MDKTKPQLSLNKLPNTTRLTLLHPLASCPVTPNQLVPSYLVTNILFLVHKKYWIQNYSSWHPACRNRHTKVPEDPWIADLAAAQPGWRFKNANMQLLTPVTSYMMSILQFGQMCFEYLRLTCNTWTDQFVQVVRVLDLRTNRTYSKLLNSLTPEYQWVHWLYV